METALWLAVLGMAVATYVLRLSFIAMLARIEVPHVFYKGLGLVPAAVLAALIVPALLYEGGTPGAPVHIERLIAGVLAALVAWRTKNVLITIGVGLLALIMIQELW